MTLQRTSFLLAAAAMSLALLAFPTDAQLPPLGSAASLDSLLTTRISAASKYAQTAAEAPASVTIVTGDELRAHRYRDLQEVLEQVRGFYVSNDRNYSYLGVRGFGRPTDYNSRVLLLIDGQALNDDTWGGAPFGTEIPVNPEAIERIEIIRGPGSALYGTSAMLAVINVVLKTGTQLDGARVRAGIGSEGERIAALAAGGAIGATGAVALSALIRHSDGDDLYFAEFDTPAQNGGVARNLDWERGESVLARASWRYLSASGGFRRRSKGIPTAPFEAVFADPRTETMDRTAWASVALQRELRGVLNLTARLYGQRYDYQGTYPFDAGPSYTDGGGSSQAGIEGIAVWDITSRNRFTLGAEGRRVTRADYWERQGDGTLTEDDQPFSVASVFAQDEFQLHPKISFVGGIRHDNKIDHHGATTPRAAIIAIPDERTTVKLLYGEAFRSPAQAEAAITTSFYSANPALRPEHIRTFEAEVQRRIARSFLVGASVYRFGMKDLIDQVAIGASGLIFQNVAAADARGVELQLDALPEGPFSGRASYAMQRTEDRSTRTRLTNSPEHVGYASAMAKLENGFRAVIAGRYESSRGTLAQTSTDDFARADLTLAYAPRVTRRWWRSDGELGLRVTNLFDAKYAVPAGIEHVQTTIPQRARQLSLQVDWRF